MYLTETEIVSTVSYETSESALNMRECQDSYQEIETIIGTHFDDVLIAKDSINKLDGGEGKDTFIITKENVE